MKKPRIYLAAVLDLYSRRIVGWAMAPSMPSQLVCAALRMAIVTRQPKAGPLVHSDRGSQGGFNRSSQHRQQGGVQWDGPRAGRSSRPEERQCAHLGVLRLINGKPGNRSGSALRWAHPASRRLRPVACPSPWGADCLPTNRPRAAGAASQDTVAGEAIHHA